SSKIFIFPSVFEGWGIAVAEALACGLLVIAYNIPALKENFGSCESVFLVPVGNLEKMIHTTLSLLNLTEEKFKELSEVSKKHVKKFGCHRKIAEKDLEILVLKNKGKKGEN
ncbi:glycosyltransferase, partial [Candidatus Bathyarchaeota archaeon]|nr:glycosyltransferase [Candidatus Bathyarchaeota archaeon]